MSAQPSIYEQPPTPLEELDRKTIEELERLVHWHSKGRLSAGQVNDSLATLWNLVAGVVPKQTANLIDATRKVYEGIHTRMTRVFGKGHRHAVVVTWQPGQNRVRTVVWGSAEGSGAIRDWKAPAESYDPPKAASDHFNAVCSALLARGYKEEQL